MRVDVREILKRRGESEEEEAGGRVRQRWARTRGQKINIAGSISAVPEDVVPHESSLVSFTKVRLDALPVVATCPSSQTVEYGKLDQRCVHELAESHLAPHASHQAPMLWHDALEERVQDLVPCARVETLRGESGEGKRGEAEAL